MFEQTTRRCSVPSQLSAATHVQEKIREVIASLDEKKQKSLGNTWRLVDGNFAAIFEQLLPNAQAKLVQVDPDDLMKGLEMKVIY